MKNKPTQIVENFNEFHKNKLNENSYNDFRDSYREEIYEASKKLVALSFADVSNVSDEHFEEFIIGLQDKIRMYDNIVIQEISDIIGSERFSYPSDAEDLILELAHTIENRYGTERRMVLQAIEKAFDFTLMAGYVEDPRDSE